MRLDNYIITNTKQLAAAGIATARLDILVLLQDYLQKDKAWILSHAEYKLQRSDINMLHTNIVQRQQHTPLAYIRGEAEFYGRRFTVNEDTLVPRPETETIIDLLKTLELPTLSKILDVGTGSGCIAITVALELPSAHVSACDIDSKCLHVAKRNCEALEANVTFFSSDILNHAKSYDIVLANLPYVPNDFQINTAATHEPKHALFGGVDGLDYYRKLFAQLREHSLHSTHVITESLPSQHGTLRSIAEFNNCELVQSEDFVQVFSLKA